MSDTEVKMYSREQVNAALNWACDQIIEVTDLPETGTVDAMNLLVNATGAYLDDPAVTLAKVAEGYSIDPEELVWDGEEPTPLQVILGWIES